MSGTLPSPVGSRLSLTGLWIFLSLTLLNTTSFLRVTHDDIYIFYRYARNIASGNGYVFNLDERILGTTSPLYTLALALGDLLFGWVPGDPLPVVGAVISGLSVLAIGLFLRRMFLQAGLVSGALLVPVIFLSMPLVWAGVGMDVLPGLALSMACLDRYRNGRMDAVAVYGALAVLTRPDMVLVPALLFLDFVRVERRLPPLRSVAVFVVIIGSWLLFSYNYFGTLVPASIVAKVNQAETGAWGKGWIFMDRFMGSWPFHVSNKDAVMVLFYFSLPVVLLGRRSWWKSSSIVVVLVWLSLYMVAYGFVINPPGYMWYYTPFAIGFALVLGLSADVVLRWVQQKNRKALPWALVFLLLAVTASAVKISASAFREPMAYKYLYYREAADWLNERAEPGDSVGCVEIGVLGYYYDKGPIIDGLGLVTPGVQEYVRQGDFSSWIAEYQPDFIVFKNPPRPVMENVAAEPWFQVDYRLEVILGSGHQEIGIYSRQTPKS